MTTNSWKEHISEEMAEALGACTGALQKLAQDNLHTGNCIDGEFQEGGCGYIALEKSEKIIKILNSEKLFWKIHKHLCIMLDKMRGGIKCFGYLMEGFHRKGCRDY